MTYLLLAAAAIPIARIIAAAITHTHRKESDA